MIERMKRSFRPVLAFLYIIIAICDFIVRPTYNAYVARDFDHLQLLMEAPEDVNPSVLIKIIDVKTSGAILPIMPETIHVIWLSVIGVYAAGRTMEKRNGVADNQNKPSTPSEPIQNNKSKKNKRKEEESIDESDDNKESTDKEIDDEFFGNDGSVG